MSSPLPLQIRVHRAVAEVPAEAWNGLLDDEALPFLEHAWLDALEQSGSVAPGSGWHPRHFTLWRGGRLVAAAPAYLKDDSYGEFVFDWSWATAAERLGVRYYPKLVLAAPLSPATGRRFLVAPGEDRAARARELLGAALDFARAEGLSSVHVLFPTEAEARDSQSLGFHLRYGVQYQWHNTGYRTVDDFLARFSSKRRNQLRRERRAPAEQGIELISRTGDALSEVNPAEVYRLYCSTVDKFAWGRRHIKPDFFARVLRTFRHRVHLVEARRAGRMVGGAFNLAGPDVLYGRYWGCFEEHPFLHFNVCLYHPVDECIALGRRRFEPGAGGEHKLTRGFEPSLTYSAHFLFNPVLDRAIANFLAAERTAIEEGLPKWALEAGLRHPTPSGPAGD